jgi:hypothetical protein
MQRDVAVIPGDHRLGIDLALITVLVVILRLPLALVLFPLGDPLLGLNLTFAVRHGEAAFFIDWVLFGMLIVASIGSLIARRYRLVALLHFWAGIAFVAALSVGTVFVALHAWPAVPVAALFIWANVAVTALARTVARAARRA